MKKRSIICWNNTRTIVTKIAQDVADARSGWHYIIVMIKQQGDFRCPRKRNSRQKIVLLPNSKMTTFSRRLSHVDVYTQIRCTVQNNNSKMPRIDPLQAWWRMSFISEMPPPWRNYPNVTDQLIQDSTKPGGYIIICIREKRLWNCHVVCTKWMMHADNE